MSDHARRLREMVDDLACFGLDAEGAAALLAGTEALERTAPEPISDKHKDGDLWMVYSEADGEWSVARWREHLKIWRRRGDGDSLVRITHALPMPLKPSSKAHKKAGEAAGQEGGK